MCELNACSVWGSFKKWCLSKPKIKIKISHIVYIFLYAIGVTNVLIFFFHNINLVAANDKPTSIVFISVGVFIIATIAQQFLLYRDLYEIDFSVDDANDYGRWVSCRLELIIRILIWIALLYGGGEISHALNQLFNGGAIHTPNQTDYEASRLSSDFTLGSVFIYLLLLVWNLFAFFITKDRIRLTRNDRTDHHEKLSELVELHITLARTLFFIVLSYFGAIYWILLITESPHFSESAILLVVIFSLSVSFASLLSLKLASRFLTKFYNQIASAR